MKLMRKTEFSAKFKEVLSGTSVNLAHLIKFISWYGKFDQKALEFTQEAATWFHFEFKSMACQ